MKCCVMEGGVVLYDRCVHGSGPINTTMELLKPLSTPSLLISNELYFIHSFHKEGNLISEQIPSETNPLIQLAVDPYHEPPT